MESRGVACTSGEGEASVKTHDPSWHVSGTVPHVLNSCTFPSVSVFFPTTLTQKLFLCTTAAPVAIHRQNWSFPDVLCSKLLSH